MEKINVLFCVYIFMLCFKNVYLDGNTNKTEKLILPIVDLIKERGFPVEVHEVTTEDGYILTLYRIKHGKLSEETNKKPVLLQHGLLDYSACFVSRQSALAYFLAEKGYDVWINNSRGTPCSRRHTTKDPDKDNNYWNFSFHEMGIYDLPAVFKHISEATGGTTKLNYIGISMGTTEFLVLGSERHEFLEYVDCVVFLAPVARPTHTKLLSNRLLQILPSEALNKMHDLGMREVFGYRENHAVALHRLCSSKGWTGRICETTLRRLVPVDPDHDKLDLESAKDKLKYFPAGSTVKVLNHFFQISKAGRFQQYDYYGENEKVYNQTKPPEYDLDKLTLTLHLICGGQDNIAETEDVMWLYKKLKNAVLYEDDFKDFTHRDFLLGQNLEDTLYKTIFQIFTDYQSPVNPQI